MSVLIKGIEMPKTCGECRFSVDGWCYAIASDDDQPGYIKPYEKAKWCPLAPVPSHGRLIDADAAIQSLPPIEDYDSAKLCTIDTAKRLIRKAFDMQPIVVQADKDGET